MNNITFDKYKSLLLAFAQYFNRKSKDCKLDSNYYYKHKNIQESDSLLNDSYKYDAFEQLTMTLFDCASNQDTFNYWCNVLLKEKEF